MKESFKIVSYVVASLVAFAVIFFIVNNLLSDKAPDISIEPENNEELFVASGEFVCLPLKDENVPHNDLCAFGIKNSDNNYYRLQSMSDDRFNLIASIDLGQYVEVGGIFIEEESDIYKTLGTIEVKEVTVVDINNLDLESDLPDNLLTD